ncbi:MAG: ArnT family glycosyltransferase, partial [Anaerolineae bacterium]
MTLGAGALALLAGNPLDPWAAILWVGSMIVFVLGLAAIDARIRSDGARSWVRGIWSRAGLTEILWIAGVTLLALGLRATALSEFPPGMHGDEGELGLLALDISEGTRPLSPFTTGWFRHPTMFHFWQAAAIGLFGKDLVGLRMLSAVVGALSVPLLYLLVRIGFGRLAGLVSASMLAASHLHIHFSRLGINNIESSMLMILTLLLVVLGATKRSLLLWGLAGLAGGYGLYFYFGSQVVPIVALLILVRLAFSRRISRQELAGFALGFVLVASPLFLHYWQSPQIVSERVRGVFLLTPKNLQHTMSGIDQLEGQSEADVLTVLGIQFQRNLRFFLRDGDASSFYLRDLPAFDPLTATLLWLGMGLALLRPFRLPEFVLLAWFWTVFVTGGMLTRDAPNAPRLLMALPAVFAFGGMFVGRGRVLLSRAVKLRFDPLLAAVLLALGALLLRT